MMSQRLISLFAFLAFCQNVQIISGQTVLPSSDVNLMNYYLYSVTINNVSIEYGNPNSLQQSGFNPSLPTTILVDGFLSNNANSMMTQTIKNALLTINYPGNIIIVDWGALSGGTSGFLYNSLTASAALALYPLVVLNAPNVGQRLAQFIGFLNVPYSSVQIFGHSEGAHVAGIAGSYSQSLYGQSVQNIIGLDPAGPLYLYLDLNIANSLNFTFSTSNQLNPSNAVWVAAYHTGRAASLLGVSTTTGFGTSGMSVGHVDLFVNGGNNQPGCSAISNPINQAYCNHKYSWEFYSSTIGSNALNGCGCTKGLALGLLGSCVCGSSILCPPSPVPCGTSAIPVGYNLTPGTTGAFYISDSTSYQ